MGALSLSIAMKNPFDLNRLVKRIDAPDQASVRNNRYRLQVMAILLPINVGSNILIGALMLIVYARQAAWSALAISLVSFTHLAICLTCGALLRRGIIDRVVPVYIGTAIALITVFGLLGGAEIDFIARIALFVFAIVVLILDPDRVIPWAIMLGASHLLATFVGRAFNIPYLDLGILGDVIIIVQPLAGILALILLARMLLAASLQDALDEARLSNVNLIEINNQLETFTYSIAHDLRAPVRAISGFSYILLNEYADGLSKEAYDLVISIYEAGQRMSRLIDGLLSFSRLSRQTLKRIPVDMENLVYQALSDLRADVGDRQIEIKVLDLPPTKGDPLLIGVVWLNLLSNAIKFTRLTERAWIEVGYRDGAYYVTDNGAGFDMKYVDKLFGVFQRLHSGAQFEGTGIGLAIVEKIVDRHGGRATASGAMGQGATFTFTLTGG